MDQSDTIVEATDSRGKQIVTQAEDIHLANLKATDTGKTIYMKVYQKWTPTNRLGKPILFCCMLIERHGGAI